MFKKLLLLILIYFMVLQPLFSKVYVGPGIEYIMPLSQTAKTNNDTWAYNFIIESRNYCDLWYGVRFDYANLKKNDTATVNYYTQEFLVSPEARYLFFGEQNYEGALMPYIQGMLTLSSLGNQDNLGRLGLGFGLGGGVGIGFSVFKLCWLLDFNLLYTAPNSIYRSDNRKSFQSVNFTLNLSVGL